MTDRERQVGLGVLPGVVPTVSVILTGGTFDKVYDVVREQLVFQGGHVFSNIADAAYLTHLDVRPLMTVDSLDMDKAHRGEIVEAIESAPHARVIIVHGTSTILETARHLEDIFGRDEKTIVLTGSLKPARFEIVEAACNIGIALCAARYFPGGVYVALHGLVSPASSLRKDRDTGRFVLVDASTKPPQIRVRGNDGST
jgi:L-asparaginase